MLCRAALPCLADPQGCLFHVTASALPLPATSSPLSSDEHKLCCDAGDSELPPQKGSSQDPARSSDRDPDLWGELEDASAPPRWRQVRRRTAVRSAHPVPENRGDSASLAHPQSTDSPPLPPLPSREQWISRCAPLLPCPARSGLVHVHLSLCQDKLWCLHGADR